MPETGEHNRSDVPRLSLVICACNEADNVLPLWEESRDALAAIGRPFEVIFVDDGSRDGTFERLHGAAGADSRLVVLRLARNFGQTAALAAGIRAARGELIALMDGDRQNDPRDIPAMLAWLESGAANDPRDTARVGDANRPPDVICGWRRKRNDKAFRSWVSRRANDLIARKFDVPLHDFGCTLKLGRAEWFKPLLLIGEMHRYIAVLLAYDGANLAEMEVNHRPRTAGRGKYGLDRVFRVVFDMATLKLLTKFRGQAMRYMGRWAWIVGGTGAALTLIGACTSCCASMWPAVCVIGGVLCGCTAIVLVALGLLGELGWRNYFSRDERLPYRVIESING